MQQEKKHKDGIALLSNFSYQIEAIIVIPNLKMFSLDSLNQHEYITWFSNGPTEYFSHSTPWISVEKGFLK